MDDDQFDEDYDPRGMPQMDEDELLDHDDSFEVEDGNEEQYDDSDIEAEHFDESVGAAQQHYEEEDEEEDPDEDMHDRGRNVYPGASICVLTLFPAEKSPSPLPPNLREISSLASWTVSTSKPGCGVAALRNTSPSQYWQSDGPQPHTLTLHFFKLVAVVCIRVYLDFDLDESYTPTKMIFAAGMGGNDLVEFATWEGDGPCGWVNVPLEGVGGRNGGWVQNDTGRRKRRSTSMRQRRRTVYRNCDDTDPDHEHDDACDPVYEDEDEEVDSRDDEDDPYSGNVLKAMVIQMRIMENHQNGKDTHVRGFQVFAADESRRRVVAVPSASVDGRVRRASGRSHDLRSRVSDGIDTERLTAPTGLDEPDWMGEPVIR
jgi:anaphase-promoting complex subunit 10